MIPEMGGIMPLSGRTVHYFKRKNALTGRFAGEGMRLFPIIILAAVGYHSMPTAFSFRIRSSRSSPAVYLRR